MSNELTEIERNEVGWMLHRHRDEFRMGYKNSDQLASETFDQIESILADHETALRAQIAAEIRVEYDEESHSRACDFNPCVRCAVDWITARIAEGRHR